MGDKIAPKSDSLSLNGQLEQMPLSRYHIVDRNQPYTLMPPGRSAFAFLIGWSSRQWWLVWSCSSRCLCGSTRHPRASLMETRYQLCECERVLMFFVLYFLSIFPFLHAAPCSEIIFSRDLENNLICICVFRDRHRTASSDTRRVACRQPYHHERAGTVLEFMSQQSKSRRVHRKVWSVITGWCLESDCATYLQDCSVVCPSMPSSSFSLYLSLILPSDLMHMVYRTPWSQGTSKGHISQWDPRKSDQ